MLHKCYAPKLWIIICFGSTDVTLKKISQFHTVGNSLRLSSTSTEIQYCKEQLRAVHCRDMVGEYGDIGEFISHQMILVREKYDRISSQS